MATDACLIDDLSRIAARALEPFILDEPYALVDFPNHSNVGDSAIWAGEMAYLRRYAPQPPAYVCSIPDFSMDELLERCPTGPIFIHGGGNFGDIWLPHQEFRNQLLERTKGRQLIQLPQSIHFSSMEKLEEVARLIEAHGAFTLFVRDQESYDLARRHFQCETILCPDMAFFIGPIPRPRRPDIDVLCLLRTDIERVELASQGDLGADVRVRDWLGEPKAELHLARAWGGEPGCWRLVARSSPTASTLISSRCCLASPTRFSTTVMARSAGSSPAGPIPRAWSIAPRRSTQRSAGPGRRRAPRRTAETWS